MRVYWVYIVRCADGTFYCGITADVERRIREHNSVQGKGARYTRARQPVTLVYQQQCPDRSQASQQEAYIKSLTRQQKQELIGS